MLKADQSWNLFAGFPNYFSDLDFFKEVVNGDKSIDNDDVERDVTGVFSANDEDNKFDDDNKIGNER